MIYILLCVIVALKIFKWEALVMAFGAVLFATASFGTGFTGVIVDFVHRPGFGTITQSFMDLTILGKIPGTDSYISFSMLTIALISVLSVYICLNLHRRARKIIKSGICSPSPEAISI